MSEEIAPVPQQPQPGTRGKALTGGVLVAAVAIAVSIVHLFEPAPKDPNIGYWDKIGQVATACEGHTGDVIVGHRYTDAQCAEFKQQDLMRAARIVNRCVHVVLTPGQGGALIDAVYNMGSDPVCDSTMSDEIEAGAPPSVWCLQLKYWNHGGGRVLRGLSRRRTVDIAACLKP